MSHRRAKRFNSISSIALSNYSHISFDIFDTALLRRTRLPSDIFEIMRHYSLDKDLFGSWQFPQNFAKLRQEAENIARAKAWSVSRFYEVTLDEIYNELSIMLCISESIQSGLKQLELKAELDNLLANEYIREIYRSLFDLDVKVFFVSDIYLHRGFIEGALNSFGYSKCVSLYLSSETRLSKSSGTLFRHIMDHQNIQPTKWLHIGDNIESDVNQPNSIGIHTLYYEKCSSRLHRHQKRNARLESSLKDASTSVRSLFYGMPAAKFYVDPDAAESNSPLGDCQSFWYEWGYIHAGPLLFGFIQWLYSSVLDSDITAVCFLARDGYFIKQAFDLFAKAKSRPINTHYTYASRRLFNLPAITELNSESIDFLVSGTSCLTVADFLERISIPSAECTSQIYSSGFESADARVKTGRDYECLRALLKLVEPLILHQATEERAILGKYFQRLGFDKPSRLLIVDLGWHGSLQVSLSKLNHLFGYQANIKGKYLGTFPRAIEHTIAGHDMEGYLCQSGTPLGNYKDIRRCVEIYEWLFSAPHGTICGLEDRGNEILPKYAETPIDLPRWNTSSQAQSGALDFMKDIIPSVIDTNITISASEANMMMASFLTLPTFKEACLFGDIPHDEGFGGLGNLRYVARPNNSSISALNPYYKYKEIKACFWRSGYFKRLRMPAALLRFLS